MLSPAHAYILMHGPPIVALVVNTIMELSIMPWDTFVEALVVKLLSFRREELAKEKRKYEEAKEHSRRQQERNSQAKKLRPRSRADSLLP
jgi:hypothetical protein